MHDWCGESTVKKRSVSRPRATRKYEDRRKKDRDGLSVLTGRPHKTVDELKPKKKVAYDRTALFKARAAGAMCVHCKVRPPNRPRGLCWHCYYAPGVAELYPSTSKFARRGVGNFSGQAPLAKAPTTAAPGTPEKLLVMEERAKLKQAIFHPADALWEGDPRPLVFLKERSNPGSGLVNERCAA